MIGWRMRINALLGRLGLGGERTLLLLSIAVGAATGLGAHLFYELLEFGFHHTFAPDGLFHVGKVMLVIVPMIGGLACGIITTYFAAEARGHGVPEVMDATYRKGGTIRPRVALAKAVASAMTIGSGGSAGTEGPIVQIGAAIGSSFGQVMGVKRHHMNTLVACGVAGGIAAIFNAPIAGVLFALEIFMRDFSFKTFSPIVFASVISTSITHALRPADGGIFEVASPELYIFNGSELPNYLLLGVMCALGALAFSRVLYAAEDVAQRIKLVDWVKPVIGAGLMGVMGLITVLATHSDSTPAFYGNGYPLIRAAISPAVFELGLGLLVLLAVLKILATTFILGSGGSGGVFAPSLFVGACLGGAFGIALHKVGWIPAESVTAYAIVGMAAVLAGATHAPLTAIVMLYELTREPRVILPIMFAAIVATGLARFLYRDSIYTLKLTRRGVRVGRVADLTILKRMQADQVRIVTAPIVHADDPLQKLIDLAGQVEANDFVVVDDEDGEYVGMVVAEDIKAALLQPEAVPLLLVDELTRHAVPCVAPNETLDSVLDKFSRAHVNALPLIASPEDRHVQGLITRRSVMDGYYEELDRLS